MGQDMRHAGDNRFARPVALLSTAVVGVSRCWDELLVGLGKDYAMMAGIRLSRLLLWGAIGALLGMSAGPLRAEEPTTTTYKSTTIERITTTREETRVETPVHKEKPVCAVFIRNRAANVPDDKIGVLQDFVTAHVTEAGVVLIGRESAMNSVKAMADAGPGAGAGNKPGADVDTVLSNNTSALQLARNLGADAILNLSISSYGTDRTSYTGHNLNVTSVNYRLKVSYELLDMLRGRRAFRRRGDGKLHGSQAGGIGFGSRECGR